MLDMKTVLSKVENMEVSNKTGCMSTDLQLPSPARVVHFDRGVHRHPKGLDAGLLAFKLRNNITNPSNVFALTRNVLYFVQRKQRYRAGIQLPLKRFARSSICSLILTGWSGRISDHQKTHSNILMDR